MRTLLLEIYGNLENAFSMAFQSYQKTLRFANMIITTHSLAAQMRTYINSFRMYLLAVKEMYETHKTKLVRDQAREAKEIEDVPADFDGRKWGWRSEDRAAEAVGEENGKKTKRRGG